MYIIDTAVIVEPRLHKYLQNVIDNAIRNLSPETTIHIFHGIENKLYLEQLYNENINSGKIQLTNMNVVNLTRRQYSDMLTTVKFWNMINGENILIFQTDSCICCNVNDYDLSVYSNYGFVGAPIHQSSFNGGFSLRKKSLMIAAIMDNRSKKSTWPEDHFYCVTKKHITKPCSYEDGLKFSVEGIYYDKPFGIHNPIRYLNANDWKKLKLSRPEISLVFDY